MQAVGLKVLKNKLSEYVRLAEQGETILVTDRDRVVAELGPPQPSRSHTASDALLAELVRKGLLAPAVYPPGLQPTGLPAVPLAAVLDELDQDREDR